MQLFDWLDYDMTGQVTVEELLRGFRWMSESVSGKSLVRLEQCAASELHYLSDQLSEAMGTLELRVGFLEAAQREARKRRQELLQEILQQQRRLLAQSKQERQSRDQARARQTTEKQRSRAMQEMQQHLAPPPARSSISAEEEAELQALNPELAKRLPDLWPGAAPGQQATLIHVAEDCNTDALQILLEDLGLDFSDPAWWERNEATLVAPLEMLLEDVKRGWAALLRDPRGTPFRVVRRVQVLLRAPLGPSVSLLRPSTTRSGGPKEQMLLLELEKKAAAFLAEQQLYQGHPMQTFGAEKDAKGRLLPPVLKLQVRGGAEEPRFGAATIRRLLGDELADHGLKELPIEILSQKDYFEARTSSQCPGLRTGYLTHVVQVLVTDPEHPSCLHIGLPSGEFVNLPRMKGRLARHWIWVPEGDMLRAGPAGVEVRLSSILQLIDPNFSSPPPEEQDLGPTPIQGG